MLAHSSREAIPEAGSVLWDPSRANGASARHDEATGLQCVHLLALVGHMCAARASDLGLGIRHQPLALVFSQDGQEVQTCGMTASARWHRSKIGTLLA